MNAFDALMQAGLEDNPVAKILFTPDPAFLKRVSTTNPCEGADPDSGVALLMKHFETNDKIYPEQAYRDFGIGRLSARVFDLNQALYERGNQYTIKCVKKTIIKKNGRKARVTDYYQFVEVDK